VFLGRSTKVKLWTGGFTHQPSIDPPWLLRTFSALTMLSVVGTLVFAVWIGVGAGDEPSLEDAIYIAILHFVAPLGITYMVTTNNPASRFLILGYFLALYVSVVEGKGFLGNLNWNPELKAIVSTAIFVLVVLWLFVSPKMRFYFAMISGKPIDRDLQQQSASFMDESKLNPKVRMVIDWFAERLETFVLLGFIAVVLYAYVSTGS